MENLESLVQELRRNKNELNWLEFKHDNYDPEMIGEDISALANGAALVDRDYAYFLWGIENETRNIVGTSYDLLSLKKGNEEMENWLRRLLSSHADFEYDTVIIDDKMVGVMRIRAAENLPITFKKMEYIRVGSYTKQLKDYPALQSRLWEKLHNKNYEQQISVGGLTLGEVFNLLRVDTYFDMTQTSRPSSSEGAIHFLIEDDLVIHQDDGLYAITNLGAILFAKNLKDFSRLFRKKLRVVQYDGDNKLAILKEREFDGGYAVEFEEIMQYIYALVPSREEIGSDGVRRRKETYPDVVLRELVANALIHQDASVKGASPIVEIFANWVEITNPGEPLIDILRIVDTPPKSRNEKLSALMRRMGLCEEIGSGWDRIVVACELGMLPVPRIDSVSGSTRIIVFSEKEYSMLSNEERLWCCYMHACVQFVQGDFLTNASLRERFGLTETSSGMISRLIRDAITKNYIRAYDPDTAPRYMKYIPIWA